MAKMKISELATEINVDKNEIVSFLQSTGFDCKSATKSIEDEQINSIKAHFGKSAQTDTVKAEAPKKAETAVKAETAKKAETPKSANADAKAQPEKKDNNRRY